VDEAGSACGSPELNTIFKLVWNIILLSPLAVASDQQATAPSALSLQQAVQIALEKNPQHKAAIADAKATSADVREARSLFMPHLSFSENGEPWQ
jgi:outer membrane protein TolC